MTDSTLPTVFCAIDTPDLAKAQELARLVGEAGCGVKLGLEFFNANGPQGVKVVQKGAPDLPLFLDLKFHDIPNTVAGAVRAVTRLTPSYLNVHASGGFEMMTAAREAAQEEAGRLGIVAPRLLAVTILTSLDEEALTDIGYGHPPTAQVERLALLTQKAGLAGVVCSAREIETVRKACGDDFVLMVPGIRPVDADRGDQKRIATPVQAVQSGATHLVIGRPITSASSPKQAAEWILEEIETKRSVDNFVSYDGS